MALLSPAEAHRQRILAAKSQGANATQTQNATAYELKLMELAEDKRALKTIQSTEAKVDKKRELLPKYADWTKGALAGAQGVQDEVLMTMLVWNIDVGDYGEALAIAYYAIEHKLELPDQFSRTLACLVAEEIADAQIKLHTEGKPINVDALIACAQMTEGEDMPDQVRAKLHKAIGYGLTGINDALALTNLKRAFELHEKSGVKKDIEKLERQLKNDPETKADAEKSAESNTESEAEKTADTTEQKPVEQNDINQTEVDKKELGGEKTA